MHKTLKAFKTIQRLFRVRQEYKRFQTIRRSVVKIQRAMRRKWAREKFKKLKRAVVKIQTWWRKCYYQSKFRKVTQAAAMINRVARGMRARKEILKLKKIKAIIEVNLA